MTGALSQNEIAAVCASAARGAGCQWGMAAEAAAAARCLAAHGLLKPAAFAGILNKRAKLSAPVSRECLSPRKGFASQCPFCLGALLCDGAETYANNKPQTIKAVSSPLLTAACLPPAARALGITFVLSWRGASIAVSPSSITARGQSKALHTNFAPQARLQTTNDIIKKERVKPSAIPITDAGWQQLTKLSNKTTVPPTPQSQSRGAGAGLTDND